VLCLGACEDILRNDPELTAAVHAKIRAPALEAFERADLFKPQSGEVTGLMYELAPLILEERHVEGPRGNPDQGPDLTVFVTQSTATLAGREFGQITYRWCYPWCRKESFGRVACGKSWRVVCVTLDEHGFPLVHEMLGDDEPLYRLFVSKSLERAAADEYGAPLPGRISSLERSLDEEPTTLVVRVLEDGPTPMGPIVYVSERERAIVGLICRCMPSQVNQIGRTGNYRLVEPNPTEAAGLAPVSSFDPDCDDPSRLERILRWPHGI
jgi:hypothetical protein